MSSPQVSSGRGWIGSIALILVVLLVGGALAAWKFRSVQQAIAASANFPEPMEAITIAIAQPHEYRPTTTSIGTVRALRSITLRNEEPGTVREVMLDSGQVVEAGTVLVALDVSVEEAELKAQEAQAALAETVLSRMQRAGHDNAVSEMEIDRAQAERDIALAQIARIKAVIARKTIRAPFQARVGMADLHPGQFIDVGAEITTLQGVDDAIHIDFAVTQQVVAGLREGDAVEVIASGPTGAAPIQAKIIAIDSRISHSTRNAMVRARVEGEAAKSAPGPGASVRVRVPAGPPRTAVAVSVSALRKGPAGDHVFVIAPDSAGKPRAQLRPVRSGAMLGDVVLIYDGLKPGEQIAESGSFKLRDGVLVAAAPNDAAPAANPGM